MPERYDPAFDSWALSQLRLYKPFRTTDDLSVPNVRHVFDGFLAAGGFPHMRRVNQDNDAQSGSDSEPEFGMPDNITADIRLRQDDYQQLMSCGRAGNDIAPLLGFRELDLIHVWPSSWNEFDFDTLLRWLPETKASNDLPPPIFPHVSLQTLSPMQTKAFDVIESHVFGANRYTQLLMIVVGTAGTGKSYLINAIRQLFLNHSASSCLKVTAPTGIAAANIRGSTIFSLLSLLTRTISNERLLHLQQALTNVKLLIIDEYSFLIVEIIDKLDNRLHAVFPHSTLPFGGINMVLCGDPAQLAPVLAKPLYAHRGSTAHIAARFHNFRTVVELDQPFRQTGNDVSQTRFRSLLKRLSLCEATEDDWSWLMTCRPSCLTPDENQLFDSSKYVVSTNHLRKRLNYDRLASFTPILKIDEGDADVLPADIDDNDDGERADHDDTKLFAVGADVMLTFNLWTEAALVNGACGTIVDIVKPVDNRKACVVMVDFPAYCGPALSEARPSVVPITQIQSPHCKGMPLTLSWAITIHKAQGMTLDRITVDLGDSEFTSGLTFVALSRAKTFHGLRVHPFDLRRYKAVQKGKYVEARKDEFRRLRELAAATVL